MSTRKGLTRHVATAAATKPLCAYLRLTVDRDRKKIGYDVQEKAIRKWAEYAGVTVGHVYKDKDITAADLSVERPEYEKMLADIEAGMWGGVVVWRLDRLVRLMWEFERCFRLVDEAGGCIISLDPSVIRSDDELGKLFMRILVMFAEMEIHTMRARARGHRRERAAQGKYNGGGPRPFGFVGAIKDEEGKYQNVGKAGVEHHAYEIALLREAADRIVEEGWSWADVLEDWASRTPPVMGTTGVPMSIQTLQRIFTGPRIVGKREAWVVDEETGEETLALVDAVWKAVINEKQWKALNDLVQRKGSRGPNVRYLLSRFVSCGRCHRPLTGTKRHYRIKGVMTTVTKYRCKSDIASKARGACGQLEVLAEPVDRLVIARLVARVEKTPELLDALAQDQADTGDDLNAALAVITDCDERLRSLAAAFGARQLSWDEWQIARMPLDSDKAAAERKVEAIGRSTKIPIPTPDQRANLHEWFMSLNLTQQQTLIRGLVRKIEVRPTGRSGPRFDATRVVVTPTRPKKATA